MKKHKYDVDLKYNEDMVVRLCDVMNRVADDDKPLLRGLKKIGQMVALRIIAIKKKG